MLFKYDNSLNKQTPFNWPLGHITNSCVIENSCDGKILFVVNRCGNVYIIDIECASTLDKSFSALLDDSWLWHRRLGHLYQNRESGKLSFSSRVIQPKIDFRWSKQGTKSDKKMIKSFLMHRILARGKCRAYLLKFQNEQI